MSIKNFDQLTRYEKERLIIDKAVPVDSMTNHEIRTILYSLSNLFIEVAVRISDAEVESIQLIGGEELDKYISNVSIEFIDEDES